jgi:hypothetical protein
MKQPIKTEITYDTTWTELAACLRALGFERVTEDPIRRIFTPTDPPNESMDPKTAEKYNGLQRGGVVEFRFEPQSTEFDAAVIGKVAQAYAAPLDISAKESAKFDAMLMELREKLKGSEAGILFESILREYPCEIARYCRVDTENRRDFIKEIRTRRDLVELVLVQKDDGNFVKHHYRCPKSLVQELIEA